MNKILVRKSFCMAVKEIYNDLYIKKALNLDK